MRHRRRHRRRRWAPLFILAALGGLGWYLVQPGKADHPVTVEIHKGMTLHSVFTELEDKDAIRNATVMQLYARWKHFSRIQPGIYVIRAHARPDEVLFDISATANQQIRLPEGYWIKRTGDLLESHGICTSAEYVASAADPTNLALVGATGSLEGYLYPDTYLAPAHTPASDLIRSQLAEFKEKIAPLLKGQDPNRVLTIASIVELEASDSGERKMIAGIINNRLRARKRLEIDATVLYAIQEWKVLPPGFVGTVHSPYNTYLNEGLPPGPICSPSKDSVEAALHPTASDMMFYNARSGDRHYFSRTFAEHQANIRKSRLESEAKP